MKRYAAFIITQYYPAGGAGDCVGRFDSLDDAKASALQGFDPDSSWDGEDYAVWDLETDDVHRFSRKHGWVVKKALFAQRLEPDQVG